MKDQSLDRVTTFLKHLADAHIHYTLAAHREEAIMVLVTVPGERWEIEFLSDGTVEVERFVSNGEITGSEAFQELFARYADCESADIV